MQPRKDFDESAMQALAASLRERGAIQPVVVRPAAGGFELVAGERRLRAAAMAGLTELPAIVRSASDTDMLELALIENIQRADLNPVERAKAYKALQDKHGLSHEQIASRMGEDRATVTNHIRLLSLDEPTLDLVAKGVLTMGHARAILGIENNQMRSSLVARIQSAGLSVRQTEAAVAKLRKAGPLAAAVEPQTRPPVKDLERRLSGSLGTRVQIREGRRRHTGKIIVEYYSIDDFERIMLRLGIPPEGP